MPDTPMTSPPSPDATPDGWQLLPVRAARLAALGGLPAGALFPGLPFAAAWWLLDLPGGLPAAAAWLVVGALIGARISWRRVRRTWWRLDDSGLGLRRDLWWQRDTRVPTSRVQHLDVRRGPLQRRARLATLVVHTAGSRFSAVVLDGLDEDDAERLRDTLARQLDQDADAL